MPHVEKIIINKEDVNISIKNILLFAGYRVSSPEVNYATRANEIKARMEAAFTPRACYIKAAIDNRGEDFVDVLGMHLVSKPLAGLLALRRSLSFRSDYWCKCRQVLNKGKTFITC